MRRFLLFELILLFCCGVAFGQISPNNPPNPLPSNLYTTNPAGSSSGGGVTPIASLPATCTPGTTQDVYLQGPPITQYRCGPSANQWQPVTPVGLLAHDPLGWYRAMPTETMAALTDWSGHGNAATGTVGTAPTFIAGTGGISCAANGAVILPTALNGATSIQVLIATAVFSGTPRAPVLSNGGGGGATSGGVGFYAVGGAAPGLPPYAAGTGGAPILAGVDMIQTTGGNSALAYAYGRGAVGTGYTNVADVMDTLDRVYINGKEFPSATGWYYAQLRSSAGLNSSNFQLCGSATGASGSVYYNGFIISALFYGRILTASEVWQNSIIQCEDAIQRGFPITCPNEPAPIGNYNTDNSNRLVYDGDSITSGHNFVPWSNVVVPNDTYSVSNVARDGALLQGDLSATAPYVVDQGYSTGAAKTVELIFAGTNDNCAASATAVFEALVTYVKARKTVGWGRVLPVTMLSRAGVDACKNSYDTLIRGYKWPDGLIDLAANPNLGADGANANATFFQAGGVHPTQQAADNEIAPIIQRGINRAYGNLDFSTANVYASAAAAAVATTAGSESTNTITITFAATPANCLVGNQITIAGTTPAGYSGVWDILTRSATQVTYYSGTTGLGAITVQGTGVCPQQQDGDVYEILNFGAGNHTLESCVGYTGQNIYIRNINAVASTLVPFASETITGIGAASATLAATSTAILQSQLVSSSAAGCNWVRLQ